MTSSNNNNNNNNNIEEKDLLEVLNSEAFKEEMKKTFEMAREKGEVEETPDDGAMEEFRKALVDSFSSMADSANNVDGGANGDPMAGSEMVEAFLKVREREKREREKEERKKREEENETMNEAMIEIL